MSNKTALAVAKKKSRNTLKTHQKGDWYEILRHPYVLEHRRITKENGMDVYILP